MRLITIGLLAVSLAAVACSGTDTSAPAGSALATPGTAPANRGSDTPPVATTGRADEAAASIVWREVTIPAGTNLAVVLDTTVASETSQIEAPVNAHLSRSVTVQG